MICSQDGRLVYECNGVGSIFLEGLDGLDNRQALVLTSKPFFVFLRVHSAGLEDVQANVNYITVLHWVACRACVRCANEEACREGLEPFGGMPVNGHTLAILFVVFGFCLAILCNDPVNMCRNTLFGSFVQIGSYILQIALGIFARKKSERAAFMVTISNLIFGHGHELP